MDLPGAYMLDLVELAGARWNIAPSALLDGLPITRDALAEPATRVPLRVCEVIVARAYARTGEPSLAFIAGSHMKLSSHGFLGFAAMTASTIREALELATRYASTRTGAIGLALYVEGGTASIVIEERAELGALREFVVIALMFGLMQLGRSLTGVPLDGAAELRFAEPAYARSLGLGARLRFAQPDHRLVFASELLDLPLTTADAAAKRLAAEQCERELAALDAGFLGVVRGAIRAADRATSITAVAKRLHVSPRTLKRRLAEHGTTFSAIRDEDRRQRALLLLADRSLSIGEVGTRLGYTELPNFTRAFRRWTGETPAEYRRRNERP